MQNLCWHDIQLTQGTQDTQATPLPMWHTWLNVDGEDYKVNALHRHGVTVSISLTEWQTLRAAKLLQIA